MLIVDNTALSFVVKIALLKRKLGPKVRNLVGHYCPVEYRKLIEVLDKHFQSTFVL